MANNGNLKSNSERTPKERKELAQKAGIKSGKVRRERKQLKEELIILLSQGNMQEKLSIALINKALSGDVKAFETIRDTIGEKPTDRQETTVKSYSLFEEEFERKAEELIKQNNKFLPTS